MAGHSKFNCESNVHGKHVACKNCLRDCWVNRIISENSRLTKELNEWDEMTGEEIGDMIAGM